MSDFLEIKDLNISFHKWGTIVPAVNGVNFTMDRNEILCIVGESGSGKSVTAKSLLRLLPSESTHYNSGEILFENKDLLKTSKRGLRNIGRKNISMIFQDPLSSLNPVYKIKRQMIALIRLHDKSIRYKDAYAKAERLLESVEITNTKKVLENYPFELSGGMRQRVMIAMAISSNPSLLIADEPTTALDVTIQSQILKLLTQIQKENGLSIMFITHDLSIVYEIADRIIVFQEGLIVEQGTRDEIFYHPKHDYTKKLLNSMLRI